MRIDSSGNVGIGEQNPSAVSSGATTLHINGTVANKAGAVRFRSSDNSVDAYIYPDSTNGLTLGSLSNHNVRFLTNSTEKMRITSAGNVGINTTSPSYKLHVNGTAYVSGTLTTANFALGTDLGGDSFNVNSVLKISPFTSADSAYIQIKTATNRTGGLLIGDTDDDYTGGFTYNNSTNALSIVANNTTRMFLRSNGNVGIANTTPDEKLVVNGDVKINTNNDAGVLHFGDTSDQTKIVGYDSSDKIDFYTNGSLRASIDNTGVGIGVTSPTTKLTVHKSIGLGDSVVDLKDTSTTLGGAYIEFQNSTGGVAGRINHNGTSTVQYNTSSDYRLKENVVAMTGALDRVNALNPCRFNFIGETPTVDGFLAHEVQDIVPEAIDGVKDGVDEEGNPRYQGIDQSKLVPLLTAALQEAVAKIEALETRISNLENQ
ncbi:MAG: tail fiber domain-containing protein [Flavobacteriia bacterium]|nr:tail fiber domain-containing protein [Flavobacteriia bacterium]